MISADEQARDDSVFVGGPHAAVAREKRGAGTFLARKAESAIEQAFDKPLETDGDFIKAAFESRADAIDHAAADHRFADGNILGPICSRFANR